MRPSPLARALEDTVRGEVRFDDGARALYATDASNYRQTPIGVVIPLDAGDVARTIDVCRAHGAPVLARGGGTSLGGQCCNEAVVIDCSKHMNRVLSIDARARRARVEPGCILDELRDSAEAHGLTFGPDPSTHNHNTLGGMIGNDSCGVHSVMAGRTSDNVESLDVLTYDGLRLRVGATDDAELQSLIRAGGRRGEIYARLRDLRERHADMIRARFPKIARRISGFAIDQLLPESGFHVARALVGSEGTCVFVCEAELRLVASPAGRAIVALGFADVFAAGDHVPEILQFRPIGLEGFDDVLARNLRQKRRWDEDLALLPEGSGWLIAEFGGDSMEDAARNAGRLLAAMAGRPGIAAKLLGDMAEQKRLWTLREAGLGATAHVPGENDTWPGWEDAAVPVEALGAYLREFRALLDRHGYHGSLYGHFGGGCVHVSIDFDLASADGIRRYRAFVEQAADLVVKYRGSFSGEHGDGQARGELLVKMFGPELVEAMREFKAIWDPANRMNPGKVVDPYPIVANLRLGPGWPRADPPVSFSYPRDAGSFARSSIRCVGIGECRRLRGGVMCPSFMATREEQHSTRGRARLLFEMLHGDPLADGWRSEAVREALDLCLACKGCKRDCPVDVDMATYKAEFFSHYYAGRLRPRAAYSMGLIRTWCRAARAAPMLANLLLRTPPFGALLKAAGGVHRARRLPPFARRTFRDWHRRHPAPARGDEVLLFPDTFNDNFHPDVAIAATRVLEAAGCRVRIPPRPLCCARPLYAWGMLDGARNQLAQILDALDATVQAGTPVIVLEPACCASLRDELPDLFPRDARAKRLAASTHTLGEFLGRRKGYEPPRLSARALVQVHCHQHAVLGFEHESALLRRLGLDVEVLDSGCCGMAGGFGFETEHYDVSMKCAERVLLPRVREASAETLVIADGFSCREQIAQGTHRLALHLAEVLDQAHRSIAKEGVA